MADALPKLGPRNSVWMAWRGRNGDGLEFARVKLDYGQHSFTAGREIKSDADFAPAVAALIAAITQHFAERGMRV